MSYFIAFEYFEIKRVNDSDNFDAKDNLQQLTKMQKQKGQTKSNQIDNDFKYQAFA